MISVVAIKSLYEGFVHGRELLYLPISMTIGFNSPPCTIAAHRAQATSIEGMVVIKRLSTLTQLGIGETLVVDTCHHGSGVGRVAGLFDHAGLLWWLGDRLETVQLDNISRLDMKCHTNPAILTFWRTLRHQITLNYKPIPHWQLATEGVWQSASPHLTPHVTYPPLTPHDILPSCHIPTYYVHPSCLNHS